jgi:hypothetical protein
LPHPGFLAYALHDVEQANHLSLLGLWQAVERRRHHPLALTDRFLQALQRPGCSHVVALDGSDQRCGQALADPARCLFVKSPSPGQYGHNLVQPVFDLRQGQGGPRLGIPGKRQARLFGGQLEGVKSLARQAGGNGLSRGQGEHDDEQ